MPFPELIVQAKESGFPFLRNGQGGVSKDLTKLKSLGHHISVQTAKKNKSFSVKKNNFNVWIKRGVDFLNFEQKVSKIISCHIEVNIRSFMNSLI